MLQPIVRSKSLGDELGELGVALVEPSSRSDSVGDVGELVSSEELHEVANKQKMVRFDVVEKGKEEKG